MKKFLNIFLSLVFLTSAVPAFSMEQGSGCWAYVKSFFVSAAKPEFGPQTAAQAEVPVLEGLMAQAKTLVHLDANNMQARGREVLQAKNAMQKDSWTLLASGANFVKNGTCYLGRSAMNNPSKAIAAAVVIAGSGYILHRLMKKSDTQILD